MGVFEKTVISQYAQSPALTAMLADLADYFDPAADFETFYTLVMDVTTAEEYGLNVWGRRVGASNVVQLQADDLFFGFSEAGRYGYISFAESGSAGSFWDGSAPVSQPYTLDNDQFRLLILAKAAFNITDCGIPAINAILLALFPGRGNAWVSDGLDMTMTYNFSFVLTAVENAIMEQGGALPRPQGVAAFTVT